MRGTGSSLLTTSVLAAVCALTAPADARSFPLSLRPGDVIATGNEWLALPAICASDGALESFNVLSMRDRGLLEVAGAAGAPVLQPFFEIDGERLALPPPRWEAREYWIPTARSSAGGADVTITYCVPPGARAALVRLSLTNRRVQPCTAGLGVRPSWGQLNRVTYGPVPLRGERLHTVGDTSVFSFVTHDTHFAWALNAPGASVRSIEDGGGEPAVAATRSLTVAAGATVESTFFLSFGLEENSAIHAARVLRETTERQGVAGVVAGAAEWCRARTASTGHADLDLLMNRNLLFNALYAWGRTIDTEQLVGVTSRSPRYYVSAAYWDRDAMLWSFPALLRIDPALAREALACALTIQLRNAGTHSRYIDGAVLEDGFQLDQAAAPLIALGHYVRETRDLEFLRVHRDALRLRRGRPQALKILRASEWDGGIVTEGIDPRTAVMDRSGRAFATAAGYVADALWQEFCSGETAR